MSKRVLVAMPDNYGLYKLVIRNLEFLGYDVVCIKDKMEGFKYKSFRERFYNSIRKVFLKDKSYKNRLKQEYDYQMQLDILNNNACYDFAIVIRADFFESNILEVLRNKTKKMISFHFDGVAKDISVLDKVKYFDKFYVFDQTDVSKFSTYNFLFSPNFYFDYPETCSSVNGVESDIYYISSYDKSRLDSLIVLHQELTKVYDSVRFLLVCNKQEVHLFPEYVKENIEIVFHYVSFADQLVHIANSTVIIDLVIANHNGLSFRIFEGLKYRKKVITTNRTILGTDFYHPNNYFLLDDGNCSEIEAFLQRPYVDIDENIIARYSFTNWINDKINDD